MAARVAPGDDQQLHHFVCASCWRAEPLERVLAEKAQALVGGLGAVLIVDDTPLVKQGRHSVGVARQHVGATGGVGNCQALVSVTLARDEVPVCLALRLYLPAEWTGDPARLDEAGVPEAARAHRAKWEIAVAEVDRVLTSGVMFDCVCADAGYGAVTDFRRALSARGLRWAVGVHRTTHVYPPEASTYVPRRRVGGRPRPCARPTHPSARADAVLARAVWELANCWLRASFACTRSKSAGGTMAGTTAAATQSARGTPRRLRGLRVGRAADIPPAAGPRRRSRATHTWPA